MTGNPSTVETSDAVSDMSAELSTLNAVNARQAGSPRLRQVNAPALIEAYEDELKKQRDYLDGVIDEIGDAQNESETRLDAEAFNQVDAVVCGLMCELPDSMLDWVADRWVERNVYS